jgi:DNA adenine methylase
MRAETGIDIVTNTEKKINTAFGYFGSKSKLALRLCQSLPPHNCWVEAFCGSAALTLSKRQAKIEIINDIDNEITNVFEQLRNNYDELIRLIELTPYSENELAFARASKNEMQSNVERARQFLVQSMMAINGIFGEERGGFSYSDSYSRNNSDARVSRWNNLPKRLFAVASRLKTVRIENKDARKVLKRYLNRPATLVYLDPPYLGDRTNGYNIDANDIKFHKELLTLANKAQCMVFISGYNNELYDALLTEELGWTKELIETSTKGVDGVSLSRTEIVWMNRAYVNAVKNNVVPITLSPEEEKHNKVNPIRDSPNT